MKWFAIILMFLFSYQADEHITVPDADVVISFKVVDVDGEGVVYYRSAASYKVGTQYQHTYPTVINDICISGVQQWYPIQPDIINIERDTI